MKTHQKIGMIAAGILAACGIGMCTAAAIVGVNSGELKEDLKRLLKIGAGTEGHVAEHVSDGSLETFSGIQRLHINLDQAGLQVVRGASDKVQLGIQGNQKGIHCTQDGDTLRIREDEKSKIAFFHWNDHTSEICLEIPENVKLKKTEIDIGTGECYIEELDTEELNLDCGIGDVHFSGIIRGDADIDCGIGSLYMSLAQQEEDFNYDLNCGVGTAVIGGMEFDGLGTDKKIDNNAKQKMYVDCGVGDVEINFEEE